MRLFLARKLLEAERNAVAEEMTLISRWENMTLDKDRDDVGSLLDQIRGMVNRYGGTSKSTVYYVKEKIEDRAQAIEAELELLDEVEGRAE